MLNKLEAVVRCAVTTALRVQHSLNALVGIVLIVGELYLREMSRLMPRLRLHSDRAPGSTYAFGWRNAVAYGPEAPSAKCSLQKSLWEAAIRLRVMHWSCMEDAI